MRRLRILQTIHDFLPRHRAGSEIYAAALCGELATRHHVTLLCAEYDLSRTHGQLTWRVHDGLPVVELVNNWVGRSFADGYRSPELTARIGQVMDAVEPDVVHAHSFMNLSFDLAAEARRRGIPVVATLHDYTLVCPSGGQRLHRAESHVCHTIEPERCVRCFQQSAVHAQMAVSPAARAVASSGALQRMVGVARHVAPALLQSAAQAAAAARRVPVTAADIIERLAQARRLFDLVDLFVAPSASIGRQFESLGLDAKKIHVSDYGFRPAPAPATRSPRGRLRIGFVGTLVWHKGAHVLLDAVRRLPADAYELRLHGDTNVSPAYVAQLRRAASGLPVQFMGGFDTATTGQIYSQLDLLVVPSLWLENSPLVIHEAFQAGVPVVGARMGGIADLVGDHVNGRLYDADSPDSLASALRDVLANPACLDEWARRLPPVKSIADDTREWEQTYARVVAVEPTTVRPFEDDAPAARRRLAAIVVNHRTTEHTWLAVSSLMASRRRPDRVFVVDNDDTDAWRAPAAQWGEDVVYLHTAKNLGFTGGVNVGVRAALDDGADAVVLVNSDAVVAPGCLGTLEQAWQAGVRNGGRGARERGIVAPLLLARGDPAIVASAGIDYNRRTGRMLERHAGRGGADVDKSSGPRVAASGCALLVSRGVWERAGLLDERHFFGFEDVDLCLRAAAAGYDTWFEGSAVAYHEGGGTLSPQSPRRFYFAARNHLLLARAHRSGGPLWRVARPCLVVALNLAHALTARGRARGARVAATLNGVADYLAGRVGPA